MIKYGIGQVEDLNSHTAELFVKMVRKQQAGYHHRPSTRSLREQAERDSLLARRMVAEGNQVELVAMSYGFEPECSDGKLLAVAWKAYDQRSTIRHTSSGDFSHLHVNPLICK